MDNVMSWEHMLLFRDFLASNDFPYPLTCAVVSVYAQLVCGILVIIGVLFRWASAIMVINFLVAIIMVHRAQSFEEMTTPLLLVFIFLFFVLNGPGSISLSHIRNRTI
ncbi:MAG: DoxX family protein [Flavisolibacter sp.]